MELSWKFHEIFYLSLVVVMLLQDSYKMPGFSATTMAHGMGYNFGLDSDNELPGPCDCTDPTGSCIMNSVMLVV